MEQRNLNPVSRFPLQNILVYTMVFLLAISLSSFFQRHHDVHAANNTDQVTIGQMHEAKRPGNTVVGFASLALAVAVITISAGLSAGRRQV